MAARENCKTCIRLLDEFATSRSTHVACAVFLVGNRAVPREVAPQTPLAPLRLTVVMAASAATEDAKIDFETSEDIDIVGSFEAMGLRDELLRQRQPISTVFGCAFP